MLTMPWFLFFFFLKANVARNVAGFDDARKRERIFPVEIGRQALFYSFRARIFILKIFEILGALSFVYFDLLRKIDNNLNLNSKNVFGNLKKKKSWTHFNNLQ